MEESIAQLTEHLLPNAEDPLTFDGVTARLIRIWQVRWNPALQPPLVAQYTKELGMEPSALLSHADSLERVLRECYRSAENIPMSKRI